MKSGSISIAIVYACRAAEKVPENVQWELIEPLTLDQKVDCPL